MRQDQRILVVRGWVACDDDWETAMGRPPSDVMSENYWGGNPVEYLTDGKLTKGLWKFDESV